jgi:hypothetical protein
MSENVYTLKLVIGSISVEVVGPKDFVEPVYGIVKPLLEKEVKSLLKIDKQIETKKEDKQTGALDFPKKATLRDFYNKKKPSSDIQAAALVAFFYSELGEAEERNPHIDSDLLVKGFKLCGHPMPDDPGQTLRNAKNYGYLDSTGEAGKFKLTPTGYNLVAHTLPSSEKAINVKVKRQKQKKTKKSRTK